MSKKYLIIFLISAVIAAGCGGFHAVNKYAGLQDDNLIEEAIEELIEEKTGVDIDLTPENP